MGCCFSSYCKPLQIFISFEKKLRKTTIDVFQFLNLQKEPRISSPSTPGPEPKNLSDIVEVLQLNGATFQQINNNNTTPGIQVMHLKFHFVSHLNY